MALSCLAGTNPVLPVNSRTSCPGKFENEIFLLFLFFFWKNKLILPRACFNNYPSIFVRSFSLVCEIIHPFGEENFIISLSCRWRVPNLIIWHIFLRQRALVSFIRVFPFCHPPETFFFRSISIGVLFCFVIFFLSPKRRAYFSIFFPPPSKWCP